MTESKKERAAFDRLKQALVDDILLETDDEILAEFAEQHGSPEANEAEMRALFEKTVILANKQRLRVARAGVAARKSNEARMAIPLSQARETLRRALATHAVDPTFTLAARKQSELSDTDVLDMLEAMRELGLLE
jgi:hypothetical protein